MEQADGDTMETGWDLPRPGHAVSWMGWGHGQAGSGIQQQDWWAGLGLQGRDKAEQKQNS